MLVFFACSEAGLPEGDAEPRTAAGALGLPSTEPLTTLALGPQPPVTRPNALALDQDRGVLWVADANLPVVARVDAVTGAWIDAIDLPAHGEDGTNLHAERSIAWDAATDLVWVMDRRREEHAALDAATGDTVWSGPRPAKLQKLLRDPEGRVYALAPRRLFGPLAPDSPWPSAPVRATRLVMTEDGWIGVRRWGGISRFVRPRQTEALDPIRESGWPWYDIERGRVWIPDDHLDAVQVLTLDGGVDLLDLDDDGPLEAVGGEDLVFVIATLGDVGDPEHPDEGQPAAITAFDAESGDTRWRTEVGRGARTMSWDADRARLWTPAPEEGSVVALDREGADVARVSTGTVIDNLVIDGASLLHVGHTADVLVRTDRFTGESHSLEVCRMPSGLDLDRSARMAWVACFDGSVVGVDLDAWEVRSRWEVGPHATLASNHDALAPLLPELRVAGPELLVARRAWRQLVAVDAASGATREIGEADDMAPKGSWRWQAASLAWGGGRGIFVDPLGQLGLTTDGAEFAAGGDGRRMVAFHDAPRDRFFVGGDLVDDAGTVLASPFPRGARVVGATAAHLVLADRFRLFVVDADDFTERAERLLSDLAAPPAPRGEAYAHDPGLRFALTEGGDAIYVAHRWWGRVDRLPLPDLR